MAGNLLYFALPVTVTVTTSALIVINTESANLLDELLRPYQLIASANFTRKIADFKFPKKNRMPSNVSMYDGSGDPKYPMELFSRATKLS
jgi:hypothetical protein